MRVRVLIFVLPLLAACSTAKPATTVPSAILAEPSSGDISGRWVGTWTGTGIFYSHRNDTVSLRFAQQGSLGQGRLVLEGTVAAESVPWEVRRAGQWGTAVVAKISDRKVALRHQIDERLFAADLELSEDGQRLTGLVRGSWPPVGLVLTREGSKRESPAPQPQAAAVPEPAKAEPAPAVVAMAPEAKPASEAEGAARPKQEEFLADAALTAVHFDFDKSDLRPDSRDQLQGHAAWLKAHATMSLLIEGHCDEMGTAEYNVALGERRAKSVRDHLAANGIAEDRITTVSYGKERRACTTDTADCHEMNRRAEFRVVAH